MPKMSLPEAYADGEKSYGPGDGIEVPAETAKKIKAYQKEFGAEQAGESEGSEDGDGKPEA